MFRRFKGTSRNFNFFKEREALIQQNKKLSFDSDIKLNKKEELVNIVETHFR
jgi:hypothetical protein